MKWHAPLVRSQLPDADFADLVLLDDLLGIHDAAARPPRESPLMLVGAG